MLALKGIFWLRLLVAIPLAFAIMTMTLHGASTAMPAPTKIESCHTQHDDGADDGDHGLIHKAPCCNDLCPTTIAMHADDTFAIILPVELTPPLLQNDDPGSLDPASPRRPPR